jgi:hypothetical protein
MVNVVHALRGTAAPFSVPVQRSWKVFGKDGNIRDEEVSQRLESLGRLIVEMSRRLSFDAEKPEVLQTVA